MTLRIAGRIARRELRGGLRGFWVFLACLALGVGAIAAVGSVRAAIEAGLQREGAALLGGEAEMSFTYRFATEEERAWMVANAARVSEIVDFRSMVVVGEGAQSERSLAQVKGVDENWPLIGSAQFDPPMPVEQALAQHDGLPGAAMDGLLVDRLGLERGDRFRLGVQDFVLSAVLEREPDRAGGGFGFGPPVLVRTEALEESELLEPGTLFDTRYRMLLPEGAALDSVRAEATAAFGDSGMRWRDSRRGAPGVALFVERIGAFLVLVGLAGLAVGGVGVSAAVRAYLDGKTTVIATLRSLGAEGRTIFLVYLMQIGVLTLFGVSLGLVLGAGVPILLAPVIAAQLPLPAVFGVHVAPLAEAAFYGVLTALIFTLWPLARTERIRAAALFRGLGEGSRGLPGPIYLIVSLGLVALLVGAATWLSGVPALALGSAVGIIAALAALVVAAWLVRRLTRLAARSRTVRGHSALRLALAAVGGPREEAASVILSLGLGLSVLAAIGQIDANLRAAIERDLPERAPSYFFIDIQNDQLPGFLDRLESDAGVSAVETAPMLRGIITRINDRPAREVAGGHWVLRGDRGVTYSAAPPTGAEITAGEWWPEDYDGPPLVSFAAEPAAEMGLGLGDTITVNILGRDITARIASFREVDFSDAGIGFIMSMNPGALAGAPHSHIATVYADAAAEGAILRDLAGAYPNITAIGVRDAIGQVSEVLASIAAAAAYAAGATLITGLVVLIGAAAAGERARVYEAAVLKTLGATRGRILASFALRSLILGAAAGMVAIVAGGLAGWAVMTYVMDVRFAFEPVSALAIVAGGALATLLAGLGFALRPLNARPAQVLRAQE